MGGREAGVVSVEQLHCVTVATRGAVARYVVLRFGPSRRDTLALSATYQRNGSSAALLMPIRVVRTGADGGARPSSTICTGAPAAVRSVLLWWPAIASAAQSFPGPEQRSVSRRAWGGPRTSRRCQRGAGAPGSALRCPRPPRRRQRWRTSGRRKRNRRRARLLGRTSPGSAAWGRCGRGTQRPLRPGTPRPRRCAPTSARRPAPC